MPPLFIPLVKDGEVMTVLLSPSHSDSHPWSSNVRTVVFMCVPLVATYSEQPGVDRGLLPCSYTVVDFCLQAVIVVFSSHIIRSAQVKLRFATLVNRQQQMQFGVRKSTTLQRMGI